MIYVKFHQPVVVFFFNFLCCCIMFLVFLNTFYDFICVSVLLVIKWMTGCPELPSTERIGDYGENCV